MKYRLWCPKAKRVASLRLEYLGRDSIFWRYRVVGCDENCPFKRDGDCMIGKVIEGVVR